MQILDRFALTRLHSDETAIHAVHEPKPDNILISNQRLAQPLHSTDRFYPIHCYQSDINDDELDLFYLKRQARESGKQRAGRVTLRARNTLMTQSEIIFALLQLNRYFCIRQSLLMSVEATAS